MTITSPVGPQADASLSAVEQTLQSLLATILGTSGDLVSPDATLEALEIDSIVIVELVLGIQTELGVRVDLGVITPSDTLVSAAEKVDLLLRPTPGAVVRPALQPQGA